MVLKKCSLAGVATILILGGIATAQTPVLSDPNLIIQSAVTSQQGATGLVTP